MGERGWDTTLQTEVDAADQNVALLLDVDLVAGTEYLWSGIGDISYGGNTYTGVGDLGDIDKIPEGVDKSDQGVELTLNYLDDTLRNMFVTTDQADRGVTIYVAVIDPDTFTVTSAYAYFVGFIDSVRIKDSGKSGALIVRVASELALYQRSHAYFLTDSHQQDLYPGDLGLEFSSEMDQPISWGRKTVQPGIPNPPGPGYRNPDDPFYTGLPW